jgi:hypothetical protein
LSSKAPAAKTTLLKNITAARLRITIFFLIIIRPPHFDFYFVIYTIDVIIFKKVHAGAGLEHLI